MPGIAASSPPPPRTIPAPGTRRRSPGPPTPAPGSQTRDRGAGGRLGVPVQVHQRAVQAPGKPLPPPSGGRRATRLDPRSRCAAHHCLPSSMLYAPYPSVTAGLPAGGSSGSTARALLWAAPARAGGLDPPYREIRARPAWPPVGCPGSPIIRYGASARDSAMADASASMTEPAAAGAGSAAPAEREAPCFWRTVPAIPCTVHRPPHPQHHRL